MMDGQLEFHASKGCTEIGCENSGKVDEFWFVFATYLAQESLSSYSSLPLGIWFRSSSYLAFFFISVVPVLGLGDVTG